MLMRRVKRVNMGELGGPRSSVLGLRLIGASGEQCVGHSGWCDVDRRDVYVLRARALCRKELPVPCRLVDHGCAHGATNPPLGGEIGRLAGHSATRPAAVRPWPRPPAAEHGRRSYTSAATTQFAHLNRGLAGRQAAWPAPRPPWPATRPSAGHIRAGPNLSLAGPNLSLAGRLAGRAAGPILGVASPDFPSGRPGGRPDLAAGRPVRQGGRPLTT